MSEHDDIDDPALPPLSAEEEARVRAALAALTPADPAAREAFRTALRARFVDGSITAPVEAPATSVRPPVAARRPRVLRPWTAALAAAALLAVAVFAWLPGPAPKRAPAWTLVTISADSTAGAAPIVQVDERAVAFTALPGTPLAPGARVALPPGVAVELRLGDVLALATAPGTAFTLPSDGPARRASIAHGEVRYVTGPAFAGTRLAVDSPQAHVEVTGTAFVVIAAPAMTCVCVGEGTVHVRAAGDSAAAHDIAAGSRREIYPDGTMSEELAVHPHEASSLRGMKRRMSAKTP